MSFDIIDRLIFFLKLSLYSVPFTAAGALATPLTHIFPPMLPY